MAKKLIEKHLRNKRFQTTEESILLAYCSIKDNLSPGRLIRTARISHSTFYRHHENLNHIVSDYEDYIYRKAKATISHIIKIKHIRLHTLYERLLNLIAANGKIFSFLLEFGSPDFLNRLILILEPKIVSTTNLSREALGIYVCEIAGLVKTWHITGFSRTNIPVLIDKISYLTNTATMHLRPLCHIGPEPNPPKPPKPN